MEVAIEKFKEIIGNVDKDIAEAQKFKDDLMAMYPGKDLDERIKIQSMVLKISDLISQKRMARVELERQLEEYKDATEKEVKA